MIYLNVIAGGANAFCTTYEFTDLDSMISGSKSFGNMDAAIFEALGFQVTSVGPGDTYDALQRGLVDSTQMGFAPMVSMGLAGCGFLLDAGRHVYCRQHVHCQSGVVEQPV